MSGEEKANAGVERVGSAALKSLPDRSAPDGEAGIVGSVGNVETSGKFTLGCGMLASCDDRLESIDVRKSVGVIGIPVRNC